MVGISSNDVANYPADSPEQMVAEAESRGYEFPYLYDETQDVAKAYHAACTPDFYLFDGDQQLVYRGQFDASRPEQRHPDDGRRPARGGRRGARGQAASGRPEAQHRLQHQVEAGRRARLLRLIAGPRVPNQRTEAAARRRKRCKRARPWQPLRPLRRRRWGAERGPANASTGRAAVSRALYPADVGAYVAVV